MQKHITIVATLQIGLSVVGLVFGVIILFVLSAIAALADDPEALVILPTIGLLVGGFLIVGSAIGIIGGVGLLKHKNWARILVLVLSVFGLFNIPIGTAVAVYTFWVLVQDETAAIFGAGIGRQGPPAAASRPSEVPEQV